MSDGRRGSPDLEAKRNAGTCLALAGLLSVGTGLFALAAVILPDLLKAVGFVAVLGGFFVMHYVTWGWWLSRPRPGDVIDDEADRLADRKVHERVVDNFADVD